MAEFMLNSPLINKRTSDNFAVQIYPGTQKCHAFHNLTDDLRSEGVLKPEGCSPHYEWEALCNLQIVDDLPYQNCSAALKGPFHLNDYLR